MTCAGTKAINVPLNLEQQIALNCIAKSDGQPYAAAACAASALTLRELQKCLTDGIGNDGCYGDLNDLVGRKGWLRTKLGNAWDDLQHGPGATNDLFGGKGFAGRTLENIRNNAPPPIQVGTINGNPICLPWC